MAGKWNKMVEAFMRAMNRPDIRNDLSRFGKTGRRERQDLNKFNDKLTKKADDIAPTEAFEGWEHGADDADDVAIEASVKRPNEAPDEMDKRQKEFDIKTEERMDANLQRDFENAFEESFNRAKGTFNEAMDKLGGYTPEDKEQAYDRLRKLMIGKLKNGEPIQDVLDWGKNKSILIK